MVAPDADVLAGMTLRLARTRLSSSTICSDRARNTGIVTASSAIAGRIRLVTLSRTAAKFATVSAMRNRGLFMGDILGTLEYVECQVRPRTVR